MKLASEGTPSVRRASVISHFFNPFLVMDLRHLEIALKINSQQEKPVLPDRKNQFPQNTKNRQSAKL